MRKALLILIVNLVACSTHQPSNGTAIDEMNVDLHQGIIGNQQLIAATHNRNERAVTKALIPDLRLRSSRHGPSRRFDISVKDVPARAFYTGLVAGTPFSVAVSPEIKGNITLSLKQVTIEQVLQTLEDVYNYAYQPIPGGYEILPNSLKTQIYSVNYLEIERKGRSNMRLSSGEVTQVGAGIGTGSGSGSTTGSTGGAYNNNSQGAVGTTVDSVIGDVETKSTVDFWKKLHETLNNIIGTGNGRRVTVNPLAGVVVVRALPKELKQVESYLDLVQNNMDRQVILEAKILEVTLSNEFQMGIDWHIFGTNLNAINSFPGTPIDKNLFQDAFKATINWIPKDFSTTIQALELQGNVQVLSSPRVSTMNNQKSLIKVGNDQFFVTNIYQNNNFSNNGLVANSYPSVNLTPFFSGITLDVTPQIDSHGGVTLHIHPSVSLVEDQRKKIDLGTQGGVIELPLAHSTVRESDTIVHAKNGQVVVIGGLIQNQTLEDVAEVPVFANIPFLGTLFRATKQNARKSELVILLRPTVITQKSMAVHLVDSTQRIASVKRGFHIGSRPDIFGTEGEEPVGVGPKAGDYINKHH